jgi:hypothetical protein
MDPKAFLWRKPDGIWGQPKDCPIYNLRPNHDSSVILSVDQQTGSHGEDLSKFRFGDKYTQNGSFKISAVQITITNSMPCKVYNTCRICALP